MRCQRDKRTKRSDDRSPLLVQSDVSIVSLSLDTVEKVFWGHDQLWDGPSNDTFTFDLSSGNDVSALYEPMPIAVADSATSHPYCGLVEKLVRSRFKTVIVSPLGCRNRGVDQEYVSDRDILSIADRALPAG
jgi:hypothetical protein